MRTRGMRAPGNSKSLLLDPRFQQKGQPVNPSTHDIFTDQEVQHGYWGARRLSGKLPHTYYSEPGDFMGEDALCLSKAPASTHSPAQERKRMARWREALPHMKLKTLIFECGIDQAMFDAAAQVTGLEALCVRQSSVTSIASLADLSGLKALEFRSRFAVPNLKPLEALPNLMSLRLFRMHGVRDLNFARRLLSLSEFGFLWSSIDSAPTIDSLEPLSNLRQLQLLWLDVKVCHGGLTPLHSLTNLVNLQVSYDYAASEFFTIRNKLPLLKHGAPFNEHRIREFCKN